LARGTQTTSSRHTCRRTHRLKPNRFKELNSPFLLGVDGREGIEPPVYGPSRFDIFQAVSDYKNIKIDAKSIIFLGK
jgi:hypothetical protein